jgi:pilus assembly protein Flp/PilA
LRKVAAEESMRIIQRFLSDERAATAIEYALIAGLVSIAIVAGATAIGTKLSSKFNTVASNLS